MNHIHNPGAYPDTMPRDEPAHVCGRCRNPFTEQWEFKGVKRKVGT